MFTNERCKLTFSFSQMLSAVMLLLQLWDNGTRETDNERSAQGTSAPLLPLLQRFQSIVCNKDMPNSEEEIQVLTLGLCVRDKVCLTKLTTKKTIQTKFVFTLAVVFSR